MGAQTTIQRWFLDPQVDNSNVDRTLRTVFTHDHFGPSTHQQAGLYAGLLVEPTGSTWTSNDGLTTFGSRSDGGPTSWQARILTKNAADSYREFMLEFQDLQLAYQRIALWREKRINPPIEAVAGHHRTACGTGRHAVGQLLNEPLGFPGDTGPSKFSDLHTLMTTPYNRPLIRRISAIR